jgi:hypothetical protein
MVEVIRGVDSPDSTEARKAEPGDEGPELGDEGLGATGPEAPPVGWMGLPSGLGTGSIRTATQKVSLFSSQDKLEAAHSIARVPGESGAGTNSTSTSKGPTGKLKYDFLSGCEV